MCTAVFVKHLKLDFLNGNIEVICAIMENMENIFIWKVPNVYRSVLLHISARFWVCTLSKRFYTENRIYQLKIFNSTLYLMSHNNHS